MVSLKKVSVCTERKFAGVSFVNADWWNKKDLHQRGKLEEKRKIKGRGEKSKVWRLDTASKRKEKDKGRIQNDADFEEKNDTKKRACEKWGRRLRKRAEQTR